MSWAVTFFFSTHQFGKSNEIKSLECTGTTEIAVWQAAPEAVFKHRKNCKCCPGHNDCHLSEMSTIPHRLTSHVMLSWSLYLSLFLSVVFDQVMFQMIQCINGQKSTLSLFEGVLLVYLPLSLSLSFFGQVMCPRQSDHMSQRSQVSWIALWICLCHCLFHF